MAKSNSTSTVKLSPMARTALRVIAKVEKRTADFRRMEKKTKSKPAPESILPDRNDMFDAASLKLNFARGIVDAVAMLNVTGDTSSLKKGSLTACLLHVDELLDEARQMFMDAHAQPAEVRHG